LQRLLKQLTDYVDKICETSLQILKFLTYFLLKRSAKVVINFLEANSINKIALRNVLFLLTDYSRLLLKQKIGFKSVVNITTYQSISCCKEANL